MTADLDARWDQLIEAVSEEFWRLRQDPIAVFEPNRDLLKLRARIDRPDGPEWMSMPLAEGQILTGDLATFAHEFVEWYRRERSG
jgi:hypothetical protein